MAATSSFDVVSDFDRQELVNTVDQTQRELRTRYDLKNSRSKIDLEKDTLLLASDSEYLLTSIRDILESKAVRRGLSLKIFDYGRVEEATGGTVRQTVTLRRGISEDLARQVSKLIRDAFPKATTQIQGDAIRVSSKSKDELQHVIGMLKERDFPVALQFVNYR